MKRYPSRIFPIALTAVLVLGACGGDDPAAGPIDSVAPQPGLRAPSPIQITAGSAAGTGGLAAPASEATADSSDKMIAPAYWISEYVVGAGMPALPSDDLGYVFDASLEVTADQVAQVAASLGVTGEPVRLDEGYGVSWRVGPDDGSAPTLWVSDDGPQSWSYNGAWQGRGVAEACAVSVDSDGTESSDCPEPEPPVGVPNETEAQQRASELMAALGQDVSALEIETYADEWFASVTFHDGADGRAAVRAWSFGFGADGVLEFASGGLAQAEPVGPYPLIDLDTALARLNEGGYWFGGYGMIEPGIAIAAAPQDDVSIDSDLPVAVPESDVEAGVEGATEGSDGGETIAVEPMPVEPIPVESMPEPEPIVVTLVDVQADLWWAWDIDGSVWLLPAYRFIDSDGGWHVVPAVADEYLIQVEPPAVVVEPLPAPEPLPVEPPVVDPDLFDASLLESFVGLTIAEFTAEAEALGASVRVVEQDGVGLAVTEDFSTTRVNVVADGEIVTRIDSVG